MIELSDDNVGNRQELTIAAPDGTTQWVQSASVGVHFMVASDHQGAHETESYRLLVGPVLAPGARAVGLVWPERIHVAGNPFTYAVLMQQADVDDESGRVELTFDVFASLDPVPATGEQRFVEIPSVAYQVTIHGTASA